MNTFAVALLIVALLAFTTLWAHERNLRIKYVRKWQDTRAHAEHLLEEDQISDSLYRDMCNRYQDTNTESAKRLEKIQELREVLIDLAISADNRLTEIQRLNKAILRRNRTIAGLRKPKKPRPESKAPGQVRFEEHQKMFNSEHGVPAHWHELSVFAQEQWAQIERNRPTINHD